MKTMRIYTRADLEAFFNNTYGQYKDPRNELKSIKLLPELNPPTWKLHYKSTWATGESYYHDLIVAQLPTGWDKEPYYLNLVTEVDLPAGYPSVVEENAEIVRKQREKPEVAYS